MKYLYEERIIVPPLGASSYCLEEPLLTKISTFQSQEIGGGGGEIGIIGYPCGRMSPEAFACAGTTIRSITGLTHFLGRTFNAVMAHP